MVNNLLRIFIDKMNFLLQFTSLVFLLINTETTKACTAEVTTVTDTTTNIQSPNYPSNYDDGSTCNWLLEGPINTHIILEFTDNQLALQFVDNSNTVDDYCSKDHLDIFDGESDTDRLILDRKLCGTIYVPTIESSTNKVRIRFVSDGSTNYKGFQIKWSTANACETNEYRCISGDCISSDLKCDGSFDCADKSDEFECDSSNLAQTCGRQEISPSFLWSPRIVGGSYTVKGSWPWQVMVVDSDGGQCGGSIVAPNLILTAAHCVISESASSHYIVAGKHEVTGNEDSVETFSVQEIYKHESYDDNAIAKGYDIAVLKLQTSITYNTYMKPVCLATDTLDITDNEYCVVTGFGTVGSNEPVTKELRQVRVPVKSNAVCASYYGESNYPSDLLICGLYDKGGSDACQGDSGGPLVCRRDGAWYQYGIVSYGEGCANPTKPGYYTRVGYFTTWFQQKTGIVLDSSSILETATTPSPNNVVDSINNIFESLFNGSLSTKGSHFNLFLALLLVYVWNYF